jgi:hypothetical protein
VIKGRRARASITRSPGGLQHSPMVQVPEIERSEYQDDPDVCRQPLPDLVPEYENIHADDDSHHREDVQHNARVSCHLIVLLRATQAEQRGNRHLPG